MNISKFFTPEDITAINDYKKAGKMSIADVKLLVKAEMQLAIIAFLMDYIAVILFIASRKIIRIILFTVIQLRALLSFTISLISFLLHYCRRAI